MMLMAWGAYWIQSGNIRATWNTPATTMVAAWIRALTGVGPSMASGSQMWSGNMALLPAPPMNISVSAVGRMKAPAVSALAALTPRNGSVPAPMTISEPVKLKLNDSV